MRVQLRHADSTRATYSGSESPTEPWGVPTNMPSKQLMPEWREQVALTTRQRVQHQIADLLSRMQPNAPEKVRQKLPGLAQRMEATLLARASSEAEYLDNSTLAQRLNLVHQANAKQLLQRNAAPVESSQVTQLFQHLQVWRQQVVNSTSLAPSDVLPNALLAKVAAEKPSSKKELAACGLSQEQLRVYGDILLQELSRVSAGVNEQAAKRRKTSPSTLFPNSGHVNLPSASQLLRQPVSEVGKSMLSTSPSSVATTSGPPFVPPLMTTNTSNGRKRSLDATHSYTGPSPLYGSSLDSTQNRMHLLAKGAGQVSQQDAAQRYELEIQRLSSQLEQTQAQNSQLMREVRELRAQLQQSRP